MLRKPRPLTRDVQDYRDDRLFIVACDDTYAPLQYFGFFELNRVKIFVVPTVDGTSHANAVLDRLMSYDCKDYDERWILLDTDHCIRGAHVASYIQALKDAENKGVNIAISRTCFELWLLLHHVPIQDVISLSNAAETEVALRKALGSYDKKLLKSENFTLASVAAACEKAKLSDDCGDGGLIPDKVATRVYKLWQSIIDGASPLQLPEELLRLRSKSNMNEL
jgi:hypothetical protein